MKTRRESRIRAYEILYAKMIRTDEWRDIAFLNEKISPSMCLENCSDLTVQLLDLCEKNAESLKLEISSCLENWELSRLGLSELSLLMLGVAELIYMKDIPQRVTINEYVDIAKTYCDSKSGGFINGILDKASKRYPK